MKKMTSPVLSVRLSKDVDERLGRAAKKLDLSKNDIARHAIWAAVLSIEQGKFKAQIPLEMSVETQRLPGTE